MIAQKQPVDTRRKRLATAGGLLFALGLLLQPAAGLAAEVVQIAAPSAAGVSRNLYPQFDVGPGGLVLNNSAAAVQTQLAGTIAGNANLAAGQARIILNEVTGTSVSQLRGMIEVAGQRAEVVIANPNGIVVDGAGFINASRAVLTTGRPVFGGGGSLAAFRVTGGQIAIQGAGLDAAGLERVDLISRAMTVNATVRAQQINAVAGANTVGYDTLYAQKLYVGGAPEVAIDVGALGGMYAGKIKLVATKRGVGVNSQGVIEATGGDIVIAANGKVRLANQTSAAGAITVKAAAIDLSDGMMNATGAVSLKAYKGDIVNTGGFVTAVGGVTVTTPGAFVNSQGGVVAGGDFTVKAGSLDNTLGFLSAGGTFAVSLGASGSRDYGYNGGYYGYGKCGGSYHQPVAQAVTFNNTSGYIGASGDLTITVNGAVTSPATAPRYAVDNTEGYISAGDKLAITVTSAAGKGRYGAPPATVYAVNNTDGYISAGSDLTITARDNAAATAGQGASSKCTVPHNPAPAPASKTAYFVNNTSGEMSAGNDVILTVQGAAGTVQASSHGKQLKQDRCGGGHNPPPATAAPYTVDNTDGTIVARGDLVITTKGAVNNSGGELTAGGSAAVTADAVRNSQGLISGDAAVTIVTRRPFDLQAGEVTSNGPIVIPNI
jgi:filamentous hemagglutinin